MVDLACPAHSMTAPIKTKHLFTSFLLIAISSILSGCGSSPRVTNTNQRSVGQQLTDLSDAYQQGIMSEKEYEKLKRAIIRKND